MTLETRRQIPRHGALFSCPGAIASGSDTREVKGTRSLRSRGWIGKSTVGGAAVWAGARPNLSLSVIYKLYSSTKPGPGE